MEIQQCLSYENTTRARARTRIVGLLQQRLIKLAVMEAKNHERRAKEEDPEAYFKSLNERYSVKFACNVSLREIELPEVDVYAIRSKTGMTQAHFASYYGFTAGAVRDWEQGKREPSRTAKLLLRVIEKAPYAVDKALEDRVL